MIDVVAAVVDAEGGPPRYGDGDDGRALLLNPPASDGWASLLSVGSVLFGALDWWPETSVDTTSLLLGSMADRRMPAGSRPTLRPDSFSRFGLDHPSHGSWRQCGDLVPVRRWAARLLVDRSPRPCRCPLGGGPSPGHSDLGRSRNVLLPGGSQVAQLLPIHRRSQHDRDRRSRSIGVQRAVSLGTQEGHVERRGPENNDAVLQRSRSEPRRLQRAWRSCWAPTGVNWTRTDEILSITDELECEVPRSSPDEVRGPDLSVTLEGLQALIEWSSPCPGGAVLNLPGELTWTAHYGETDPICGWYSSAFGRKQASVTLVGRSMLGRTKLLTTLDFSNQGSAMSGGIRTDMATARSKR